MRQKVTLTTLGLLAGLAILLAVATLAYRQLSILAASERLVDHTHEVLEASQALVIAVDDAVAARRAFALTRDETALIPYRAALGRVTESGKVLRRLTADNPSQQSRLDVLDPVISARVNQLDEAIREARTLGWSAEREVSMTQAGNQLTGQLRALVAELDAEERRLLDERQAAQRSEAASVRRVMLAGFSASVLLLILAFLSSRRDLQRRARSEEALAERERRLAILLKSIGDAVIATDAAGVVTHLNPVAEELTGWTLADAVGKRFAEVFKIINEKTRAPSPDPVAKVLVDHVRIGLANHTALIRRDGSERSIADSAAPILDDEAKLHGVVIVFRDVTETKMIEARFRHLVEAAPDAIVIADVEGRITVVNDQACTLFGYAQDELIGQPVELLIPEKLRPRHVEHRNAFRKAPSVRSMGTGLQLMGRRKDGTQCPVEVSLSPLQTPEGTQVIAAVRDVTRRRELERFRDEYVGYISHDLKNPLSIISLQARLLAGLVEKKGPVEEKKRALRVIADSSAFIDRLVRELLEMAYVESDQIEIRPEPVELPTFLQSVLERTVSSSDRARVTLEIVEPATVAAESNRLERVVVNFVQNAIKYSPPGSPIRVRQGVENGHAVVAVIDSGPGLAPEDRSFVFDKYRRTDSARSKEGLGLGLYISRKIIEAHGGEIGVESTPGKGATFFVKLPRVADVPRPAIAAVAAAAPAGSRLRGLKVLLVDDEANAVSALTSLLGDEGLDVAGATSGEQALALVEARKPDVAVLDVQMPGMSGLALLELLRKRLPGLPAVIMSGYMAHHAGIAEARESSGAAYVGKPVDIDELIRTLDRLFLFRSP